MKRDYHRIITRLAARAAQDAFVKKWTVLVSGGGAIA